MRRPHLYVALPHHDLGRVRKLHQLVQGLRVDIVQRHMRLTALTHLICGDSRSGWSPPWESCRVPQVPEPDGAVLACEHGVEVGAAGGQHHLVCPDLLSSHVQDDVTQEAALPHAAHGHEGIVVVPLGVVGYGVALAAQQLHCTLHGARGPGLPGPGTLCLGAVGGQCLVTVCSAGSCSPTPETLGRAWAPRRPPTPSSPNQVSIKDPLPSGPPLLSRRYRTLLPRIQGAQLDSAPTCYQSEVGSHGRPRSIIEPVHLPLPRPLLKHHTSLCPGAFVKNPAL